MSAESSNQMSLKDIGATSVHCSMLTATNYTVWAMRMKVVLSICKAWVVIDPGTTINIEKNDLTMWLLYDSILKSIIIQRGNQVTTKKH